MILKSDSKFKENLWFQTWSKEFCEFLPNSSRVWKFLLDGFFVSKVYKVWARKIQRSYLSLDWTVIKNLNKYWSCALKNGMSNWVYFIRALKSLKNCTLMDSFCSKRIMFQLKYFIEIMCHDTEGWCKT